jgi:hypothetical protein
MIYRTIGHYALRFTHHASAQLKVRLISILLLPQRLIGAKTSLDFSLLPQFKQAAGGRV